MKRYIFFLLLSLPLLWSCSDNDEDPGNLWDILPLGWQFQVTDADGNDLLNPETPNAYGVNDIKITCTNLKGDGMEMFNVGAFNGLPEDFGARFKLEVVTYPLYGSAPYAIGIMGYDADRNWPKIEAYIDWPDGSQDYIEVHHTFWAGIRQSHFTTTYYLNGTEVSNPFTIVK